MRTILRLIWMALVLLIVALSSALLTMRLAVHGRELEVPNLLGKTPAEAKRISESQGLTTKVEREYYSSTVQEGRVLSQMPAPRARVRHGWKIALAVSLGPQRVMIPQIVGQSDRVATIVLQQRGLQASNVATMYLPNSADGQVIGQSPPPNAVDVAAPRVSFLVAEGDPPPAYVMPSFIGQPVGSVALALKDADLPPPRISSQPAVPQASQPPNPSGTPQAANGAAASSPVANDSNQTASPAASASSAAIIISQDPAPGQRVAPGSVISFTVR